MFGLTFAGTDSIKEHWTWSNHFNQLPSKGTIDILRNNQSHNNLELWERCQSHWALCIGGLTHKVSSTNIACRYRFIHGYKKNAFCRYVKYNPSNDMLITGIRRENNVLNLKINDEPDENNETRLISCSSFLDHLMRSLRSIIDSMETRNFINLVYYWRNIHMQIVIFYNMLKDCTKAQLKPNKLVRSIDVPECYSGWEVVSVLIASLSFCSVPHRLLASTFH